MGKRMEISRLKAVTIWIVSFRKSCRNRLPMNVCPLDLTFPEKVYLFDSSNGPWPVTHTDRFKKKKRKAFNNLVRLPFLARDMNAHSPILWVFSHCEGGTISIPSF
jgi:hypothetical protein